MARSSLHNPPKGPVSRERWVREEAESHPRAKLSGRNPPTATTRNSAPASRNYQRVQTHPENKNYPFPDNRKWGDEFTESEPPFAESVLQEWRVAAAEVIELLRATRELFLSMRWAAGALAFDEDGRDPRITGKPQVAANLKGALGLADKHEGFRVYQCTQAVLCLLTLEPLARWEKHPLRRKADITYLLDLAAKRLGGSARPRRGGWRLGVNPSQHGGGK